MAGEDDVQAKLAQARAAGVEVSVDREAGTMRVRVPPELEVDMFFDVLRAEHPDDPVEAAREFWHLGAPTLRRCGWSDERIIRTYRIPDEVLSGEADRRSFARWAAWRLTWIEGQPESLLRGERELIRRHRTGELDLDTFAARLGDLFRDHDRRRPAESEAPPLPEPELRVRTEGGPEPEDWVGITVDHLPSGRRACGRMTRRFLADGIGMVSRSLAVDLWLVARGLEPLHDDHFTPEDER